MAKIGRSDSAPEGDFEVGFAVGTVNVPAGGDFETNDPRLVAEAANHPYLAVTDYTFDEEAEEQKGRASAVGTPEADRNPEAPEITSDPAGEKSDERKNRRSFDN